MVRAGDYRRRPIITGQGAVVVAAGLAPAGHRAVVEHRAGQLVSSGHGECRPAVRQGRAGRRRAVGGGPVAQLAVLVLAPAGHRAVVENRAGVVRPGGDGDSGPAARQVGVDGQPAADGGAVAQLAVGVGTPAGHRAVVCDGAGVLAAGGDVPGVVVGVAA